MPYFIDLELMRGRVVGVKKDPGIPNLFPYKEQLLLEARQAKEQVGL